MNSQIAEQNGDALRLVTVSCDLHEDRAQIRSSESTQTHVKFHTYRFSA